MSRVRTLLDAYIFIAFPCESWFIYLCIYFRPKRVHQIGSHGDFVSRKRNMSFYISSQARKSHHILLILGFKVSFMTHK